MRIKSLLTVLTCFSGSLLALPNPGGEFAPQQNMPQEILINNCVLVKVYGKPITVMDVVKKMDLLFYRQYPELADNPMARFQYYTLSWKPVLESLVEDAMVMADAEEKEVTVSDGDIREELERLFGPDVVANLDKMEMTLDEAYDLLKAELTVAKMMGAMVRARAMTEIHPKSVREAYLAWLEENPPEDRYVYRVLSIRSEEESQAESVAEKAKALLESQALAFEELPPKLKSEGVSVSLSESYDRSAKEISLAHLAVLQTLAAGDHSTPIVQSSRGGGSVRRIFFLEALEEGKLVPFQEIAVQLENELTNEAVGRHRVAYIQKLREQFGMHDAYVTQRVPDDFEPFTLR